MIETNSTATAELATADEVTAQIRAWIDAGLPCGDISPAIHDDRLMWLQVTDPGLLAVWAVALGERIMVGALTCTIGPVRPDLLGGWRLQVWCDAPVVPDELRIEVAR